MSRASWGRGHHEVVPYRREIRTQNMLNTYLGKKQKYTSFRPVTQLRSFSQAVDKKLSDCSHDTSMAVSVRFSTRNIHNSAVAEEVVIARRSFVLVQHHLWHLRCIVTFSGDGS